jgi:hypothetical protein
VTTTLDVKLASLVVHVQEAGSADGRQVDVDTAIKLANDPEVVEWLAAFDPALLPVKREGEA